MHSLTLGLTNSDFQDIQSGAKTVEVRAASTKNDYSTFPIGTTIIFENELTHETNTKTITFIHFYRTAEELYQSEGFKKINPNLENMQTALDKLYAIPTYKERIIAGGVYAIGIA